MPIQAPHIWVQASFPKSSYLIRKLRLCFSQRHRRSYDSRDNGPARSSGCTTDVVRMRWPPQERSHPRPTLIALQGGCDSLGWWHLQAVHSVEVTLVWVRARSGAHLWLQGLHCPKRYGPAGSLAALLAITRSSHMCDFAPPSCYLRRRITKPWLEDSSSLERPHICPPEPAHAYGCLAQRLLARGLHIFLHMCRAVAFRRPAHCGWQSAGLLRLALQPNNPKAVRTPPRDTGTLSRCPEKCIRRQKGVEQQLSRPHLYQLTQAATSARSSVASRDRHARAGRAAKRKR